MANPEAWTRFREFIEFEKAVGGPDPHMAMVIHMSQRESTPEAAWRAGCYIGAYNVPAAQLIWQAWPWPTIAVAPQEHVVDWCRSVWPIPTRRERRSVRTPEQMGRFLWEYGQWVSSILAHFPDDYEAAWEAADAVYTLGRYVRIKLLEFYRRIGVTDVAMPDVRPRGGWSPREGLALLFPEYGDALGRDDAPERLRLTNTLAAVAKDQTGLDYFELQVFLCEFKASWSSHRQYPGRSHDSELDYFRRIPDADPSFLTTRREMFPVRSLGELAGWDGPRKDLGHVLADYGYTWSDLRYNYLASKDDLSKPVPW